MTDRGEFFGIRDLQTLSEGIDPKRSGGDIEEADGIQDVDWDAELAGTSLDQRHGALANTGMPGNRKHHGPRLTAPR